MYSIDKNQFYSSLDQFCDMVRNKNIEEYNTESLSFSEGFLREQEWYKHELSKKAQDTLDVESWTKHDIGTGIIVERVKAAFHIKVNNSQQNIINWREILRAEEIFDKNPKQAEIMLFNLFCEGFEEESFNSAIELLGHRYAVVSYLMFIKDSNLYVPVRPTYFSEQFKRLGISSDSLSYCTWNHYQEFLEIVRWVHNAINPYFSDVSLIDAHSFIWMMWILGDDENNKDSQSIVIEEEALPTGSPEWFFEKSQVQRMDDICERIENLRGVFLDGFSVQSLSRMSGSDLLKNVFSDSPTSMMRILMFNDDYRWFGAAGQYKYLGILYQGMDGAWVYKEGNQSKTISRFEAEKKAEAIRDDIINCVREIENIGVFKSIQEYKQLQDRIENVFFYKYPWMMKYYQMLFPQYFPGMYADNTLNRALYILGLPNHGKTDRLLNAGEVSLFIRTCNINNIVFNQIYEDEWGWEEDKEPCQFAPENLKNSSRPVYDINIGFYKTPAGVEARREERASEAIEIEKVVDSLQLVGIEKEAMVKVRVNQGEFRNRLIKKYHKCCLCGVSEPTLLIASHIKPWSVCTPEERLDEDNGFLLCPNHDKLFDSGLISFDNAGDIIISDELNNYDKMLMNINEKMRIRGLNENQKKYLQYHRERIYRGL